MENKKIKILVATHKCAQMPKDDMYIPLHVGREGKTDLGFVGDNTGDNISLKNSLWSELTGLYWCSIADILCLRKKVGALRVF